MAREIERKFLIQSEEWRSAAHASAYYRQGYMANTDKCSIRVRVDGERAYLNIKSATLGIVRTEYEYAIPKADAEEMLDSFCSGAVIEKTRYFLAHEGFIWEIDVFDGVNRGLVVAEIELDEEDTAFPLPPWAGREVSDDPRYYNVYLARHPYSEW